MMSSVVDPNLMSPMRSPRRGQSFIFTPQTIFLAMSPATCLTAAMGCLCVMCLMMMRFDSLTRADSGLSTLRCLPGVWVMSVIVPWHGLRLMWTSNTLRKMRMHVAGWSKGG